MREVSEREVGRRERSFERETQTRRSSTCKRATELLSLGRRILEAGRLQCFASFIQKAEEDVIETKHEDEEDEDSPPPRLQYDPLYDEYVAFFTCVRCSA